MLLSDAIVTNIQLKTANPARPWVTGLAILHGKLATLGSSAEVYKMLNADQTRVVDARGRVLSLPADISIGSELSVEVDDGGEFVALVPLRSDV